MEAACRCGTYVDAYADADAGAGACVGGCRHASAEVSSSVKIGPERQGTVGSTPPSKDPDLILRVVDPLADVVLVHQVVLGLVEPQEVQGALEEQTYWQGVAAGVWRGDVGMGSQTPGM